MYTLYSKKERNVQHMKAHHIVVILFSAVQTPHYNPAGILSSSDTTFLCMSFLMSIFVLYCSPSSATNNTKTGQKQSRGSIENSKTYLWMLHLQGLFELKFIDPSESSKRQQVNVGVSKLISSFSNPIPHIQVIYQSNKSK